jgi:hypothetical protein
MTIIGGAYALYEMFPRVQISKGESLDPDNAFETQFVVTNNSTFRLTALKTSCSVNTLRARDGARIDGKLTLVDPATGEFVSVSPGESATVPCAFNKMLALRSAVSFADVTIAAEYSYPLWWRRIRSESRFVTRAANDGQLRWFPQPVQGRRSD